METLFCPIQPCMIFFVLFCALFSSSFLSPNRVVFGSNTFFLHIEFLYWHFHRNVSQFNKTADVESKEKSEWYAERKKNYKSLTMPWCYSSSQSKCIFFIHAKRATWLKLIDDVIEDVHVKANIVRKPIICFVFVKIELNSNSNRAWNRMSCPKKNLFLMSDTAVQCDSADNQNHM